MPVPTYDGDQDLQNIPSNDDDAEQLPNGDVISYYVEEILDKRLDDEGNIEYLIKWHGFGNHENTWEPEDNLDCITLIDEYERSLESDIDMEESDSDSDNSSAIVISRNGVENNINAEDNSRALDITNMDPEKILGASNASGQLVFLIKFKTVEEPDLVTAAVANIKWPELVIKFYEERLSFNHL